MTTSLTTNQKILYGLDLSSSSGIEIGALANPVLNKDVCDVRYVDRASTDQIKQWYSVDHEFSVEDIVDIDYIWGEQSLAECTNSSESFDFCIASHVIEHIPDLITWLQEISSVLKPGGIASFAVPDKRFTFDYLRSLTTPGDLVEAYLQKLRKPSPRQIYDHYSNYTEIDISEVWSEEFDGSHLKPLRDHKFALSACMQSMDEGQYIDSHCSVFTQESFVDLIDWMFKNKLADFRVHRFFPVEELEFEFVVQLEKLDDELYARRKYETIIDSHTTITPHTLRVDLHCSQDCRPKLYYDIGNDYNEKDSSSAEYVQNQGRVTLQFQIPPLVINGLRFDPHNSHIDFEIYSITLSLFSQNDVVIPLTNITNQNEIEFSVLENEVFQARSDSKASDPWIMLELPDELNGRM